MKTGEDWAIPLSCGSDEDQTGLDVDVLAKAVRFRTRHKKAGDHLFISDMRTGKASIDCIQMRAVK
jgi:hypothetical protein